MICLHKGVDYRYLGGTYNLWGRFEPGACLVQRHKLDSDRKVNNLLTVMFKQFSLKNDRSLLAVGRLAIAELFLGKISNPRRMATNRYVHACRMEPGFLQLLK